MESLVTIGSGFLSKYIVEGLKGIISTLANSSASPVVYNPSKGVLKLNELDYGFDVYRTGKVHNVLKTENDKYRFGTNNLTHEGYLLFGQSEEFINQQLDKKILSTVQRWFVKILGRIGGFISRLSDNTDTICKIANGLGFDNKKARMEFLKNN